MKTPSSVSNLQMLALNSLFMPLYWISFSWFGSWLPAWVGMVVVFFSVISLCFLCVFYAALIKAKVIPLQLGMWFYATSPVYLGMMIHHLL